MKLRTLKQLHKKNKNITKSSAIADDVSVEFLPTAAQQLSTQRYMHTANQTEIPAILCTVLSVVGKSYARTIELYYVLCWSELSRHKLLPALATAYYTDPDNAIGFVAQCELIGHVKSG